MKIEWCENSLDSWSYQDSPYASSFQPSIVYKSIEERMQDWVGNLSALEHTETDYHGENLDLSAAAAISRDLRSHSDLIKHWLNTQSTVDAMIPFKLDDVKSGNITNTQHAELLSLVMAGRKPVLITPGMEAYEHNYEIYIKSEIVLPKVLLSTLDQYAYLLKSNRLIVLPYGDSIDSCISEDESGTINYNRSMISDTWGIIASSNEVALQASSQKVSNSFSNRSLKPHLYFLDSKQASSTFVDEHAESYAQYLAAMQVLQNKIQLSNSESEIDLAFTEIEQEFRLLDHKYSQLQRKLRNQGIEVIAGLAATTISLALPDSAEILKYILSSSTAFSGVKYLSSVQEKKAELELSPYWLPWKAEKLRLKS